MPAEKMNNFKIRYNDSDAAGPQKQVRVSCGPATCIIYRIVICSVITAVLYTSTLYGQYVPLGEAIRKSNQAIINSLDLNTLPSPKTQQASKKEFSEAHWHGLELIPLSSELRREYGIQDTIRGLLVDESTLEAAECGFLAGDVILYVGKFKIQTLDDFLDATLYFQNRKSVSITVWRSMKTQALTGDVGITDGIKRMATIEKSATAAATLQLPLVAAARYKNLGYADMSTAPPIQPGSLSPHKNQGKPCASCHIFMNTGGQLAVDAGDILPDPPTITQNSTAPHAYRGKCNFCHTVLSRKKSSSPSPLATQTPAGRAVAAATPYQNPPPITQNSSAPHAYRGDCNVCHNILPAQVNSTPSPPQPSLLAGKAVAASQPYQNTNAVSMSNGTDTVSRSLHYDSSMIQNTRTGQQTSSDNIRQQTAARYQWQGLEIVPLYYSGIYNNDSVVSDGICVDHVNSDSPFHRIGLRRGDIITDIGQIHITDLQRFKEIVSTINPGSEIKLSILRKGKKIIFDLSFDRQTGFIEEFETRIFKTRTVIVIGIFAFVYFLILNNIVGRIVSFPLGAVLILFIGYRYEFYVLPQAIQEINYHILLFIVGMNIIITVLNETGFFEHIAGTIAFYNRGNRTVLFFLFCILTYIVSAFMDNIATILVLIPLTLELAKELRFDPKPMVIGELIASNLGGASTMFGDFPNLLISFSSGLQFHDFILYEMPCCLIMLCAMFVYMRYKHSSFFVQEKNVSQKQQKAKMFSRTMIKPISDKKELSKGLIMLGFVITGMIFLRPLGINPGIVALVGGFLLMLVSSVPKGFLIKNAGWVDVAFFTSLFIIVGAAEACGLLAFVSQKIIVDLSAGHLLTMALLLMYLAALITAFMNAGPTAAIFIPIVNHFGVIPENNLFWWALSLGIVSGASASLYGASGGPLASSILVKYWKKTRKNSNQDAPLIQIQNKLDMQEYFKTGGPIMIIFLIISTMYISLLHFTK